jgi:hypothetical protein
MFATVRNFLQGKKTYIAMGVTFTLAGLAAVGVHVPDYVYAMLFSLGLIAMKAGQVTVPDSTPASNPPAEQK